ncbi:phosphatidylinositol 3 and 4-kinase-domain-containing protein [Umbelopsis sp. AD052]|nr:phosphatidylinositol 3 and 4-kinase-domain-containing protein [Umbelopsis sp. AD052]
MSTAPYAPLPPAILGDIENGDSLPSDDEKGWTIVLSRRKRRERSDNETGRSQDKSLYKSIFTKHGTQENSDSITLTWNHLPPLTKEGYMEVIHSVQEAIDNSMYPTRISQGSSGSYFCRDTSGKIVGVFKPKNEEPYGNLNPKWTKWVHRNLFPCCFGRSCLIPNLGYMSEAATSLIDRRLQLNIVPFTDVIHMSSPTFHYDRGDRKANDPRKPSPRPLPSKIGSFQCFLNDFNDASMFLRNHPFPADAFYSSSRSLSKKRSAVFSCLGSNEEEDEENQQEMQHQEPQQQYIHGKKVFQWTRKLQQQFKREFENLAILDYLIRNTDRGTDNWMIRYCEEEDSVRLTRSNESQPVDAYGNSPIMTNDNPTATFNLDESHLHVAAIDNGLAFPFKHPDQWRSYPYAWLSLPHALLVQPISVETRKRLLPMLSDPEWWEGTVRDLHRLFSLDSDFEPRMFERQLAVLKGQGWNIVQTLRDPSAGILDLVTRKRCVVWEEDLLIEWDQQIIDARTPSIMNTHAPRPTFDQNNGPKSPDEDQDDDVGALSDPEIAPARSLEQQMAQDDLTSPSISQESTTPKKRWNDRLRRSFSLDRVSKSVRPSIPNDSSVHPSLKKAHITVERIEIVEKNNPYFTWC